MYTSAFGSLAFGIYDLQMSDVWSSDFGIYDSGSSVFWICDSVFSTVWLPATGQTLHTLCICISYHFLGLSPRLGDICVCMYMYIKWHCIP